MVRGGEDSFHGFAAAHEFQTGLDRADQEALPIGQRGKLPYRLGPRQRLERCNILQIHVAPGSGWAGRAQPDARAEQTLNQYPTTIFWRCSHHKE
jgi:hypothetical protein